MKLRVLFIFVLMLTLIVPVWASDEPVRLSSTPLRASACSGSFVAYDLPHTTISDQDPIRYFDSNGSGVAINDLNGDSWLDVVLVNLDAPGTILWNQGGLMFRQQTIDLPAGGRGAWIVDVDGDGLLDIVFTTQRTPPLVYRNRGDETFEYTPLPDVTQFAYTLDWADADADGDLDLATGSYDAELNQLLRDSFLFSDGAGVFYFENLRGAYRETRLAESSQALALLFVDLTDDGVREIAVGNDFRVPDQYFALDKGAWTEIHPFGVQTYSTMSFDAGDLNNDGRIEFYAADMEAYPGSSPDMSVAWELVERSLSRQQNPAGDPQITENVLQTAHTVGGRYENTAGIAGINATGWSWSAKFGDLDSDGHLDLYVVNGMIAADLFDRRTDYALVEENQAFRNLGDLRFESAPAWALNSPRSGRGMSMGDMDGDGDLDIVVNNLAEPAQLFENQLCGGDNLIVSLRREDVPNTYALGAWVTLHTDQGVFRREVRAGSGYLSGDPAQAHFGVPRGAQVNALVIEWGDGKQTRIDAVRVNTHLIVTRL